jgi:hypothetical protein
LSSNESLGNILGDLDIRLTELQKNGRLLNSLGEVIYESAEKIFGKEKMEYLKIISIESGIPCKIKKAFWYQTVKEEWINENIKIFNGNDKRSIMKTCDVILEEIERGSIFEKIAKKTINKNEVISEKKELLKLQNRISLLNTIIAKNQDLSMGVFTYFWKSYDDEIFEDELDDEAEYEYPGIEYKHRVMHGLICRWDDPTLYSHDGIVWIKKNRNMIKNHPGFEYLCRCAASPYFASLVGKKVNETIIDIQNYSYLKEIISEDRKLFRVKDNVVDDDNCNIVFVTSMESLNEEQSNYEKGNFEMQAKKLECFVNKYRKNFHIKLKASEYEIFKKEISNLVIPKKNDSTIGWVYYWNSLKFLRDKNYNIFENEYQKAITYTDDNIMKQHMDKNILSEIEQIGSQIDVENIRNIIKKY